MIRNGIPIQGAQSVTLIISQRAYEKANRFKVEEIVESKYTDVNLNNTEDGYKMLICRYRNDEMRYYFQNNQLIQIKETYSEQKTDENKQYEENRNYYKNLTEDYKKIKNFNSTFVEDEVSFTQINRFNLHDVTDNDLRALKTYRFFSYRTHKNVVAFEAEAQGYTCS